METVADGPVDDGHGQPVWYLVHAKPRQEAEALRQLERQEYTAYLPRCRVRRRVAGRIAAVIEPMFPRYLFVRLAAGTDDFSPIRSTRGVQGLVRFGGMPARLPDALIAQLRAREGEAGLIEIAPEFQPGARVQIAEGPFAGLDAVFEARAGKDRAALLLHLAGQVVRMSLPMDALTAPADRLR